MQRLVNRCLIRSSTLNGKTKGCKENKDIGTRMLWSCIGALKHRSIGASMKGFFRIGKLNGKTKGGKKKTMYGKGERAMAASSSWNQQLEGKENANNQVSSLLL